MLTKEYLENAYWKENKSMPEIAKELGISRQAVYYNFLKFQIPTRKRGQWWKEIRDKNISLKTIPSIPDN